MTIITPLLLTLALEAPVDFSKFEPATGIKIERNGASLRAEWPAGRTSCAAIFSLDPAKPLFESLEMGGVVIARELRPVFTITSGSRTERANERYIFFDKPALRATKTQDAVLDLNAVRVESHGARATISFSKLSAGPFAGELVVKIYSQSPFLQVEAAMSNTEKLLAYIYDFQLEGQWNGAAWKDNLSDQWVRASVKSEPRAVGVRNRAIFGETDAGVVAIFPPPHAFFFPRDYTVNFKFAQVGNNRFGLRQDPAGGPGHQGAFIPWFDASAGKTQHMGAFVMASTDKADVALDRIKRYTHNDAFKPIDGHFTFTTHWHMKLTMNELAGKHAAAEAAKVFKGMNVNLVHLAEFHGDGDPADPGPKRLPQLKAMFDLCRKYSDDRIVFIPGEEANAQLNIPAPAGTHSGHWLYLFPKPVYLTLVRGAGVPFTEKIAPYGTVYHAGSEADMFEILKREKALAWTAHPRIKASFACPDSYKEKDWFKDDLWLGGAWKAMPGDLSEPRLGVRVLDLLDDMNTWGQRKQVPGEVDTFDLDSTHELYGHMNINYLKLDKRPTIDDWSPVLGALRRGDFFTTTGEVLIHSFEVKNGQASAQLEWTFPLSQVLLVSWDGQEVKRQTIPMHGTSEFGSGRFEWPVEGLPKWVRLEAWDVAFNGAFTQPRWLRP